MVRLDTILKGIIGFLILFFFGFSSQVMGQETVAQDDASNYTDWTGNEGTGFANWIFQANADGGDVGTFLEPNANSASPAISTTNKSWGTFANNGTFPRVSAFRNLSQNLRPGDIFTVEIQHGDITGGGSMGFTLRSGTASASADDYNTNSRFEFAFVGGQTNYSIFADGTTNTGIPFNSGGLRVSVTIVDLNTVDVEITELDGPTTTTLTNISLGGTSDAQIESLALFNRNARDANVYFNSLDVTLGPPTQNATNFVFDNIQTNQMDVSWTSGNGENRIVVAREGAAVSFFPENGTDYPANADFSVGSEVGPTDEGNKVVYNGTGESFTLTGLDQVTTYHFAVIEYNGTGTETAYLTSDNLTGSQITANPSISSAGTGNWLDDGTWVGGVSPNDALVDVTIEMGHTVTINTNANVNSITINSGATLQFEASGGRTITISDDGFLTNSGGTFTAEDGTMVFAGSGDINGAFTFNNLDLNGEVSFSDAVTIADQGTLNMLAGSSITTNSPSYASGSTLRYARAGETGLEWPTGEAGAPHNVTFNNGSVNFGSTTSNRFILGNLIIEPSGELALSSASAVGGDLELFGNWTNQGSFNANRKAVFFRGSGDQNVTNEQATGIEIDFLINFNSSGGVTINSNEVTVIRLENNGTINLNGNNLELKQDPAGDNPADTELVNDGTFNTGNGNITFQTEGTLTNNNTGFDSGTGTIIFEGSGAVAGTESITFYDLDIRGGVVVSGNSTISNSLRIDGGYLAQTPGGDGINNVGDVPDYGTDATIIFAAGFGSGGDPVSGFGNTEAKTPTNLTVQGPSGNLTMVTNKTISGIVTVESGAILNANENLTIASGAVLTNNGTINGDITFERLFGTDSSEGNPLDQEGFRMFSAPVETSLLDLLSGVWTQGVNHGEVPIGGDPNIFLYENDAWSPVTGDLTNITLAKGTGVLVYVFADDNYDGTPNNFPKTLSATGTENGDSSPAVNETEEAFTLVGNPFARTIEYSKVLRNEIEDAIYVWDATTNTGEAGGDTGTNNPGNGSWRTYDADGGLGDITGGLLTSFQGFFIQTSTGATNPSITFNDDARSTGGSFYGKQNSNPTQFVRLEMNNENISNSTWLRFSENGSLDGQVRGDALQLQPLSSNYAQLATGKADETLFDINHLPLTDEEITIPLHVSSTASGTFTLRATDFELPEGFELIFNDHNKGESIAVTENFEYQIQLGAAAKMNSVPPLKRLTQEPMVAKASSESAGYSFTAKATMGTNVDDPYGQLPEKVSLNQNYPNPFNPSTVISYQLPENSHVKLEVFDMLGRNVATLVNGQLAAGTHEATFDAGNLSSGMYIYRLQAGNTVLTRKLTLIK